MVLGLNCSKSRKRICKTDSNSFSVVCFLWSIYLRRVGSLKLVIYAWWHVQKDFNGCFRRWFPVSLCNKQVLLVSIQNGKPWACGKELWWWKLYVCGHTTTIVFHSCQVGFEIIYLVRLKRNRSLQKAQSLTTDFCGLQEFMMFGYVGSLQGKSLNFEVCFGM